jgi:hypothetical protein
MEKQIGYLIARSLRLLEKQVRGARLELQIASGNLTDKQLDEIASAAAGVIGRATQIIAIANAAKATD